IPRDSFLGIYRGTRSSEYTEGLVPRNIPRDSFLGIFRRLRSSEIPDENSEKQFVGTSDDWTIGKSIEISRGSSPSVYSEELSDELVVLGVSSEFRRKIPRDFRGKINFRGVISEDLFRRYLNSKLSSARVFFLDCRSYNWHEAPSMRTRRNCPNMSAIDGKIYVVGKWNVRPSNSIEIYDPKTQIWESVPCPITEILGQKFTLNSLAIDGKLYLLADKCMVYRPVENKWDVGYWTLFLWTQFKFTCVICNVLSRVLKWLVNYERLRIAVLWVRSSGVFSREKVIWCAVIAVERRNGQEIYGKIEWCDVVLTVPKSCCVLESIAIDVWSVILVVWLVVSGSQPQIPMWLVRLILLDLLQRG
ncbi:unnamed protein product, partial [Brassica oleracea var. botrytis]